MNMFDEARSLRGTMEMCNMRQSEIAEKLGVSQSYVANKLRLLNYSDKMQRRITDAGLSERHARALLRLRDEAERDGALDIIVRDSLNVAETEALIEFLHNGSAPKMIGRADRCSRIDAFQSSLKSSLEMLCSLGINARKRTSYYGKKTYITICIDEV